VSHDRAFLNNVVTSTLVFDGSGTIEQYIGGYDDWLRQRKTEQKVKVATPKVQVKSTAASNKLSYKDQRELDGLPAQIEQLEIQISATSELISAPGFYQGDRSTTQAIENQLASAQKQLAEFYARWELLENQ
jgi:ATP-binding cassette subfamily F protein uup